MSKRSSSAVSSSGGSAPGTNPAGFTSDLEVVERLANELKGQDKQKMLLSENVGHFSLVRAMHLADLITLMNGMSSPQTGVYL